MKTFFDHIEHIKGKPRHIRKQIAFGAATFGSAMIALVWFIGSLATGAFAMHSSDFAIPTEQENTVATKSVTGSGIAGAAAAIQDAKAPVHIEIVDTAASPAKSQSEQTTIPF
ncbi:MAG: hypothetical protein WCW36_02880 [Candidatus Paceibacterota bacterium]|jgi:hypothetical protein